MVCSFEKVTFQMKADCLLRKYDLCLKIQNASKKLLICFESMICSFGKK